MYLKFYEPFYDTVLVAARSPITSMTDSEGLFNSGVTRLNNSEDSSVIM